MLIPIQPKVDIKCVVGSIAFKSKQNNLPYSTKNIYNDNSVSNLDKAKLSQLQCINIMLASISWLLFCLLIVKSNFRVPNFIKSKKSKFVSLADNGNIPALENCKSVNKELREMLERQIQQAKSSDSAKDELGGVKNIDRILLHGSPGVGKSFFAKIYAKSIGAEYMEVFDSDITSRWVGAAVENMKKVFDPIFKTAQKNKNKKYVVTFNEIDTYFTSASKLTDSEGTHSVSLLKERSAFINYLDELKEKCPNVTVIGTTNTSPKSNGIDGALLSRFQLIGVPYPDKDCLYEALKMNLNKMKNGNKFITANDSELKNLAEKMSARKFSFRNLDYVIDEAKRIHLKENPNTEFKFSSLEKAEETLKLSDGELEKAA